MSSSTVMTRRLARLHIRMVCREHKQPGERRTGRTTNESFITLATIRTGDAPSGQLTSRRSCQGETPLASGRQQSGCWVSPDVDRPTAVTCRCTYGAQFSGEHWIRFIEIGCAAKSFEEKTCEEAMLAWLIRLSFLHGGIAHHQHHTPCSPLAPAKSHRRLGHARRVRTGRGLQ